METRTFTPDDGDGSSAAGDSGGVVELDAPVSPLPDLEDVPDTEPMDPGQNDMVQPDVLHDGRLAGGDDGGDGELTVAQAGTSDDSARSRLPTGALVGLAGLVALAAVAMVLWVLRWDGRI